MSLEFENMWYAMKPAHYKRSLELLKEGIRNAHSANEAVESALNVVVDAIHAEAGTFWFYDRFGDDMIYPAAVYGGRSLSGIRLKPKEGVAGEVIDTGESTIIPDCQKDSRWAGKTDSKTGFCTKTMICVPLHIYHLTFGSIQIINKKDGLPFDQVDLEFTEKLAEAASEMLADQDLLRGYVVYAGREKEDDTSFESIVLAPSKKEMARTFRRMNCYQLLNHDERIRASELMEELYGIFASPRENIEGKNPKKGFWGLLK